MAIPPPTTAAQMRLQDAMTDHFQGWVENTNLVSRIVAASVVSTAAGAAADGSTLVKIRLAGVDVAAPYLSSYTPALNHIVAVARTGSSLLILGRVIGTVP